MRTFRIDRVTAIEQTGRAVARPEGFDLADAWRLIAERFNELCVVSARALIERDALPVLQREFGSKLRIGPAAADGRIEVEVVAPDQRVLIAKLAGFGALAEVTEPIEYRRELARIGRELAARYDTAVIA
jgi:predicted DNA-binding transcriptional regulator YafY